MLLEALLALATILPHAAEAVATPVPLPAAEAPHYDAQARAVSNWRAETGASLTPVSLALTARLSAVDPAFVARCVKLNNYWCIKRARWPGEIGADAEGHTGFHSAAAGADAAANLLRRYYQVYGRRSALAIVRRWAPAACGLPAAAATAAAPRVSAALAPQGLGRTLRARYLARHARGGAPRRPALRAAAGPAALALRVQPWSPLARMAGHPGRRPGARALPPLRPVADIAAGAAAAPREIAAPRPAPARGADDPAALLDRRSPAPERLLAESAALPFLAAGGSLLDLRAPPPLCADDSVRIANYAARIAASVGVKPDDDLALFAADGSPLPNLAPVMRAMSAVELGTLRASPVLVSEAIARLSGARRAEAAPAP